MNRPIPTMPNPGVPEKRGARPPARPLEMLDFLIAIRDHREDTREYLIDNGFSPKVIYAKALKAARKGYTDYGVVADRPRLTAKGRNFIEKALEAS